MQTPDLRAAERALRADQLADDVDELLADTPAHAAAVLTTSAAAYAATCGGVGIDLDNADEAAAVAAALVAVSFIARTLGRDVALSAALVAAGKAYREAVR